MFLLPGEQGLPAATVGVRLFARDAAMRSGVPYAIVGRNPDPARRKTTVEVRRPVRLPPPGPPREPGLGANLPWWGWLAVGCGLAGIVYWVVRQPDYVVVGKRPDALPPPPAQALTAPPAQVAGSAEAEPGLVSNLAPEPLTIWSSDADLLAAFEQDAHDQWLYRT